jgi:hypothetical protein
LGAVAEVGPVDTAVGDVATSPFGLMTSPPGMPPGTVETRDGFQMGWLAPPDAWPLGAVAEVGPGDTAVGDVATSLFGLITSPPGMPPGTVETRDGFQTGWLAPPDAGGTLGAAVADRGTAELAGAGVPGCSFSVSSVMVFAGPSGFDPLQTVKGCK